MVSPELEYVILSAPNDRFALFKVILAKGGSSGAEAYRHQGLEAGIVLKGKVRITVGGKSFVLPGFDSCRDMPAPRGLTMLDPLATFAGTTQRKAGSM